MGLWLGGTKKKIINYRSISKCYSFCRNYKKKYGENTRVNENECTRNHDGSSKSMECSALLKIIEDRWSKKKLWVGTIVYDDDTTMKRIMRYKYDDLVRNNQMELGDWPINEKGKPLTAGNLSTEIPEPVFLADFNHRVKSVGEVLYDLALMPKKRNPVDKAITKRLTRYWSKMLIQRQNLDVEKDWEVKEAMVRALVEHNIFNNHQYYSDDWCYHL